ncbi:MAG: MarR family transcriptional regulator [Oscillospiraceae bacterium]|nr:MarR family transcriptional regulator [Oscillospiraceae bacterium]
MAGIVEEPFKAISILYRKSHIWLSEGCEQYDLTAAQAVVILIVCDHGELTQDEVTKRLSLDKSVIAKTVTKLAELGFIERSTNPKDKRTFDIRPTEKARAAYPHVQEQIENCFGRMTGRMSDSERDEFRRLLLLAAETTLAQDE